MRLWRTVHRMHNDEQRFNASKTDGPLLSVILRICHRCTAGRFVATDRETDNQEGEPEKEKHDSKDARRHYATKHLNTISLPGSAHKRGERY